MWTIGNNTTIDELLVQCDYHAMRDDPVFRQLTSLAEGVSKCYPNKNVAVFDDLINSYDEDITDLKSELRYAEELVDEEVQRANEFEVEVKALRMHCHDNLKDVLSRAEVRGLKAELHDVSNALSSMRVSYQLEKQEHNKLQEKYQQLLETYNTWSVISG